MSVRDRRGCSRGSGRSPLKVVIGTTPRVVAALEEMRPRLPFLTHLIAIDAPKDGAATFEGVLERGRAHANVTSNIATTIAIFPFTPDDRMLSFLPRAPSDVKNVVGELAEVRPTTERELPTEITRFDSPPR